METTSIFPETLFTKEQIDYVNSIKDEDLRGHLLHQVRLRDMMEADRNTYEKMYNDVKLCYKATLNGYVKGL